MPGPEVVAITLPVGPTGLGIVQMAVKRFGRVDTLINNAGTLRDKTFAKMTPEMWEGVLGVHLQGAYNVTSVASGCCRQRAGHVDR